MSKHSIYIAIVFLLMACQSTEKDPFLYLEEVDSKSSMDWVNQHNEKIASSISNTELFKKNFNVIQEIRGSKEQILKIEYHGDFVYNLWQGEQHPHGIYRRMHHKDFSNGKNSWETVLDVDSLSQAEGKNWKFNYCKSLAPEHRLGMISLSDGGTDANVSREFDLHQKSFVKDGFIVPEAKGMVVWNNENELYVNSDFGRGSLTKAGYPRVLKLWSRGEQLTEAKVIYELDTNGVGMWPLEFQDGENRYVFIDPHNTYFDRTYFLVINDELYNLDVPKSSFTIGVFKRQVIIRLNEAWEQNEEVFKAGSIVSFDLADTYEGFKQVQLVYEPVENQSVEEVMNIKGYLIMNVLDNVKSKIYSFDLVDGSWLKNEIPCSENVTVAFQAASANKNVFYFTETSFLNPTGLYRWKEGDIELVQSLPSFFNSYDLQVKQEWAISKDGTRVPYFIVAKKGIKLNGNNPTIQYAYGGFMLTSKPYYDGKLGKLWLEQGGVYVVANIRGGGELGADWHKYGSLEHKQNCFDDFYAVSEKLIADSITSPEYLGAYGRSNGGLLVGAAMTQRPELYKAIVCGVPILDMQRYNKLLAGSSWEAEYGNPDSNDWEYLKLYSPYHNIKEGVDYPEVLFMTSTKDDRVHPGHARKMAAKMESIGISVHYYESKDGGHGLNVTPAVRSHFEALRYSFFEKHLMN